MTFRALILGVGFFLAPPVSAMNCDECDEYPDIVCPDPTISAPPSCVRVSPGGELDLEVQVLGCDGNPLAGTTVEVVFNPACVDLVACETGVPPTVLTAVSDASGRVAFVPRIGGCCTQEDAVSVFLDGVRMEPTFDSVGSPDITADGEVKLGDFVIFQSWFLQSGQPCADLSDCDETVNLSDFVEFQALFLASCP